MANKAIGTLAVGSSLYLNVGGVRKEFLVVHQGLPSSIYDDSCNGTWLLMKDIYENRVWQSRSINKYESSDKYKDDLMVAVNGETNLIQRGVTVKVKRKVLWNIQDQMRQDASTANLIQSMSSDYEDSAKAHNV
jgi:hypothetical protein